MEHATCIQTCQRKERSYFSKMSSCEQPLIKLAKATEKYVNHRDHGYGKCLEVASHERESCYFEWRHMLEHLRESKQYHEQRADMCILAQAKNKQN